MTELYQNQSFVISHADDSPFASEGLRAFFEYRDLNIKTATKGAFGAHVIRAVPGVDSPGDWHTHDLTFQMVYVTCGWDVLNTKERANTCYAPVLACCSPPESNTGKYATLTTRN